MIESKFKYFPDNLIQIIPTEMISLIAPLRYMYICVSIYRWGVGQRGRRRESRQYCWLFRDISFQSDYLSSNPSSAIFAMTLGKLCVLFTFHNKKIKLLIHVSVKKIAWHMTSTQCILLLSQLFLNICNVWESFVSVQGRLFMNENSKLLDTSVSCCV